MQKNLSHTHDKEVWIQIIQGDELALTELYDQYVDILYNYGQKITPKSEVIEDAIQELLAEIWYRREKLAVPNSVKAYLLHSFRQKLLKQLSQYKRISFTGEYLPTGMDDDHQYLHTQILSEIESEHKVALQRAIATLSRKEREAIALRYTENLSHDEIAKVMALKKQSLYNLLHGAIQKLAKAMREQHPSGRLTAYTIALLLSSGLVVV